MKRFLIVVTLGLVVLCFIKGSEGRSVHPDSILMLNRTIDGKLAERLVGLVVASEISAALRISP